MKKLFEILIALILCTAVSIAEVVGVTPEGKYIVSHPADNGQMLYCISFVEEPQIQRADVNFDGADDYVFTVGGGADFTLYEFFVWDGDKYVLAMHPCTTDVRIKGPISNYELYPELGLVYACVNAGENGAHFIKYLLRWEGTNLMLLRRAEGAVYTWHGEENGIPVSRQYGDMVHIDVRDYAQDDWGAVLYDEVLPLSEMNGEKHQQIDDVLWQGVE